MYQPVKYGISNRFFSYYVIPGSHRQLAGDDSRFAAVPVFNDLHQIQIPALLACLLRKINPSYPHHNFPYLFV